MNVPDLPYVVQEVRAHEQIPAISTDPVVQVPSAQQITHALKFMNVTTTLPPVTPPKLSDHPPFGRAIGYRRIHNLPQLSDFTHGHIPTSVAGKIRQGWEAVTVHLPHGWQNYGPPPKF